MKKQFFFLNFFVFNEITPLFVSMLNNKTDILKVLLTRFKDTININYSTSKYITALHLLFSDPDVFKKEQFSNSKEVEISEGKIMFLNLEDLNFDLKKSQNLYSPFQIAIFCNNFKLASLLIEKSSGNLDLSCKLHDLKNYSQSIFDYLISRNQSNLAIQLLDHGYKMEFSKTDYFIIMERSYNSSGFNNSLFYEFFFSQKHEIIEKMINENKTYFTCFIARYRNENDLSNFLDNYPDININDVEPNTKMTPLFSSALNSDFDNLKFLLNKFNDVIDVNYAGQNNITVTHIICRTQNLNLKNIEGIKMLFKIKNLNPNIQENDNLKAPLHYAVFNSQNILSLLLECPNINVNIKDKEGNTPLHVACKEVKRLKIEIFKKLLSLPKIDIMALNSEVLFLFF